MKRTIQSLAVITALFSNIYADDLSDMKAQIDVLSKKVVSLEKKQKRTNKTLSKVKKHEANDNIKFGIDFRNAVDVLEYKFNNYTIPKHKNSAGTVIPAKDISGTTAKNSSLLTSRLYLTMAASPMQGLIFKGKLAVYSTWGSHLYVSDAPLKDWAASSKPADAVMRIKEAYFVYSNAIGNQPISVSIGRRPSTNGYLANYRENEKTSGSPSAHTTNMEVNAAMVKLDWSRFVPGAYTKFVYGRAHTGAMENVYGTSATVGGAYSSLDNDNLNVDFFVMPGMAYNDGQYEVMYQWAHIFNTKGQKYNQPATKKDAAGYADLLSLGFKVNGIGDEINDFLDETTLFVSLAMTTYNAKDGHQLLGSDEGGSQTGSSIWAGVVIPDGMTDAGKFGFEYNHGSKYWTPMSWAEDTAIGSKVSVRGSAYEAYWNFNLFGVKYLPSQVRYTYIQHDYTPNINCAGWVAPEEVDIVASDLRFAVSYRY